MKSIFYVSEVVFPNEVTTVPSDISQIYHDSREKNKKVGIGGILYYSNGHYMQILEGPDDEIDYVYESIRRDPRHKNVITLLESEISTRSFPSNPLRIAMSGKNDAYFNLFYQKHKTKIDNLSPEKIKLLGHFYISIHVEKPEGLEKKNILFDNKRLRLKAWPDFSKIPATPGVIELCAKMTYSFCTLEELVSGEFFDSRTKLINTLVQFEQQDILETTDLKPTQTNAPKQGYLEEKVEQQKEEKTQEEIKVTPENLTPDADKEKSEAKPRKSFYSKMASFLGIKK